MIRTPLDHGFVSFPNNSRVTVRGIVYVEIPCYLLQNVREKGGVLEDTFI